MKRVACLVSFVLCVPLGCGGGEDPSGAGGSSSGGTAAGGSGAGGSGAGGSGAGGSGAQGTGASSSGGLPEHWQAGLGEGVNWGLAEAYPNDTDIASNAYVLAAEDFETGTVTIPTEENRYADNVVVTNAHSYTGQYAGTHSWPDGHQGPTTRFVLTEDAHQDARPAYFMRMCFDYDDTFHPVDVGKGVGVKGFGIYFEDGSGNASSCDGMSWFNVSCQFVGWGPSQKPEANDGYLWVGHLYSYNPHPELATAEVGDITLSDPPDGTKSCRFSSYAEPFEYIKFNSWRCYELGLYLNTPGQADGEARLWIDGVLQSRSTSMRFRDLEEQKPNNMQLNLHRTTAGFPQTMVRWVDNIVLSRRYIGPVKLAP